MDLAERTSFLARLPHFRALSRACIERLAAASSARSLETDESLFREGEPAQAFFAVVEGRVRIYRLGSNGQEQVLHHMQAGQSFAEAAVLSLGRYPADARALSPSRVMEIDGEAFAKLLHSEPGVSDAMVSSLSMWLLKLAERVEELSIASAPARLARYLLRLPTTTHDGRMELELPLAKKDLAAHLAIAPETLSRLLRRWQDAGVIENRTRSLVVCEPRVLIAIADQEDAGPSDAS